MTASFTIGAQYLIRRLSDEEKDLEIFPKGHRDGVILRQQLSILQRKLNHPIRPNRIEKLTLGVLTTKFKRTTRQPVQQLQDVIRIFQLGVKTKLDDHQSVRRLKNSFSISLERTIVLDTISSNDETLIRFQADMA